MLQIRSVQRFPFSDWVPSWIFRSRTPWRSASLRDIVRRVDPFDFAERPEGVVLVQQAGAEPLGLQMPAADALFQQRLDLLAQRSQLGLEPGQFVPVLEILAVSGDHRAGGVDKLSQQLAVVL